MIDTDKYEGHSEDEWIIKCDDGIHWNIHTVCGKHLIECRLHNTVTNLVLMADAPLLLAEVKRLRDGIQYWFDTIAHREDDVMLQYFKRLIE